MASLLAKKAMQEALEKTIKESAEKLAKEGAEKLAKEGAEKLAKEGAEKLAKEAAEKLAKEAAEKLAKESAEKLAKESAEKLAKESAEKAAKEAAEKAAKEAAEKAAKTALPSVKKMKKAAITAAGLTALGLGAAEAVSVYNRSKELFDKRNGKQFNLLSIASSNTEITITFINTDNLKIYAEEEIEITGVDAKINGRFSVIKQVDTTTITVVRDPTKPLFNLSNMTTGSMKLFADQKNDAADVIQSDIDKLADLGKSALCNTIAFLKLTPYVDTIMNGSYIVFLIICIMILVKIADILTMVLGKIPYVKMMIGVMMLGVILAIHFLIGPLFALKC
jgi:hypothetical protein